MNNPLVSIIIPFYNEERFLPRAIDSAINQSYYNKEIILVNDGSIDSSKLIAQKYCEEFENINFINSLNESVGAARNKGIIEAKGEYITFLDADDELHPRMIEICIRKFIQEDIDISIVKVNLLSANGGLLKISGWKDLPLVVSSIEGLKGMYSGKIIPTVWGKLYKSSVIKPITFTEGIWFEDTPFLVEAFLKSKKIGLVNHSLLSIHSRKNSITRRLISEKRIVDLNETFLIQIKLIAKSEAYISLKNEFDKLIFSNQFQAMLDTFFLLKIDEDSLDEVTKRALKVCFLNHLSLLNRELKNKNIKLSFKIRLLFWIMISPKHISWTLPQLILVFLKRRKYNYLKKLKG